MVSPPGWVLFPIWFLDHHVRKVQRLSPSNRPSTPVVFMPPGFIKRRRANRGCHARRHHDPHAPDGPALPE